ncbi:hypothetical protein [Anaerosphaera multitolerans]|uniref:Lipoprotein n=1 Tax=Anaerosphaera multitolerans TaxID=2487351 RepID=A0A437S8E8_9FIRM|nr:hypothetical protein [Anaerosphaera multitolerans]RVU55369.1 hypothetical protein EF514_03605 [Anaerosphaera multitolerans]
MRKKSILISIGLVAILLVGCGTNNKQIEHNNQLPIYEAPKTNEDDENLEKIKEELSNSVDTEDGSIKIKSVSVTGNSITTILEFKQKENIDSTITSAFESINNISDYLLNLEKWENYVILFDDYGAVKFNDSEKKKKNGRYYIDTKNFESDLKLIFGVN